MCAFVMRQGTARAVLLVRWTSSAFMVLDAEPLGRGLRAIGVLNPRSHPEVFAMLDAAGAADMRLASWRLR